MLLQNPGFFVEVGAVDGLFMSQTIVLEEKLNWTGLLIEPDPRNFQKLLHSGRNASYCSLCVTLNRPSAVSYIIIRTVLLK